MAGLLLVSCKRERPVAAEGREAPDVNLVDASGRPWRLSGMRGSVVLINFWATWCASCQVEMPSLQRLYEAMKTEPRFKIAAVLFRDNPDAALQYLSANKYGFPLLLDPDGNAAVTYRLTGVPETFIVDKKGVLRKKVIGSASFDTPEAIAFFRNLIEEK